MSKTVPDDLYPDLAQAGGLAPALNAALVRTGSELRCGSEDGFKGMITYGAVTRGSRHSQVLLAARTRSFHADFCESGVMYGGGWSESMEELARAIDLFVGKRVSPDDLVRQCPWVSLEDVVATHQRGPAEFVEARWRSLENLRADRSTSPLLPMIRAAAAMPALRQLLPFTSMVSLCFSRCTGYPYTHDCPSVAPTPEGRFRVYAKWGVNPGRVIGEGTAQEAADLLVRHLPPGVGPAVHGTANDLHEESPGKKGQNP